MRHKLKTLLICISIIVLCCFPCITASAASNLEYSYQYKLGLERLLEDFPSSIDIVDDEGNSLAVNVAEWNCLDDYDQNLGVYHFTPVISEDEISKLYHIETSDGLAASDTEASIVLPELIVYVQDEGEGTLGGYLDFDDGVEIPFYDDIDAGQNDSGIALLSLYEEEDNSYYNAFENELLPVVRDQNPEGACWAFSSLGAMEANLIRKGYADTSLDLSELHLAYFATHKYDDPLDCRDGDTVTFTGTGYLSHGGVFNMASKTLANGAGAVRESYAPYSRSDRNTYVVPDDYAVSVDYAYMTQMGRININDRASVKDAIKKYGSVCVGVNGSIGNFKNSKTDQPYSVRYSAVYNSAYGTATENNHAVMIVGWDDNFSKDHFYEGLKPSEDGAWLVRNSWGLDDYGRKGYFWLSYCDGGLLTGGEAYYFEADPEVYDHIYAYDSTAYRSYSYSMTNGSGISQTFTIKGGQNIEAIGYETLSADLDVDIAISYLGKSVQQSDRAVCIGYHTVELDEPINIASDTEITVAIRFNSNISTTVAVPYENLLAQTTTGANSTKLTYHNIHEARETKLLYANGNAEEVAVDALLKVLTNDLENQDDKLALTYTNIYDYRGSEYQLELTIDSIDAAMNDISWTSDDTTIATVDEYGCVTVGYKKGSTLIHGQYTENGKTHTIECSVTVKPYSISYKNMDGVKGNRVRTYYPGDISNSKLSTVYKEGYSLNGWYLDEALTQRATSPLTTSRNIVLYPKWNDASLTAYYYPIQADGSYGTTTKQLISSPVSTSAMPYGLPGADDSDDNPNDDIQEYNASHGTKLTFDYWSTDAEGNNPIDELDISLFNLHMEEDGLYHQNSSVTLYPQYREGLAVSDVSLQLNGRIGVNFYLDMPAEASYVVLSNGQGRSIKYPISDIYKKESKYCYTYNLAIKEIADDISLSVYDKDDRLIPIAGNSTRNGSFYYSAQNYISYITNPDNNYASNGTKLYNLCHALDDYSSEVRHYFNYNTDDSYLAKEIESFDFSAYQPFILLEDDAPRFMGASLVLDSDTAIRLYFYNTDEAKKLTNYTFTIVNGSNEQIVYPVINGGYGYIEIRNIPAAQLDKQYTLKIYSSSNEYLGELGYSALSYAYRASFSNSNTDSLMRICNYLKLYNDAAKAYWADMQTYYSNSVASLQLNYNNLSMNPGESSQLIANCLPMDSISNSISWSSSDPSVVSVDAYGNIRALAYGEALIKAKSINDVWSQCLVTVGDAGRITVTHVAVDERIVLTREGKELVEGVDYIDAGPYLDSYNSPTEAIQAAINQLTDTCNTVYISKCSECLASDAQNATKGTCSYGVNAADRIYLKSNINIVIDDEVYLIAKPNGSSHSDVFKGENVSNITISGGHITGERYTHKNNEGEWGMGVGLYSCNNVKIYGVDFTECWGDGVYIGSSDNTTKCNNIQIIDCKLYNNRRNNMSIVAGDNVLIDGCEFSYANGTDPQSGLDIETNYESQPCNDISIFNSRFYGNSSFGFAITTIANRVDIVGCKFDDGFLNYAGLDSQISDSSINSVNYMRYGMSIGDNVHINDGTAAEDTLVAYYSADVDGLTGWSACYNTNSSNQMSIQRIVGSDDGNRNAIRIKRSSNGTVECGCGIKLSDISLDGTASLNVGDTYRFEFVVKGTGNWGAKTTQSPWYPIMPVSNRYMTCIATQPIENTGNMTIYLYTTDLSAGGYLDVESIRVYKVN